MNFHFNELFQIVSRAMEIYDQEGALDRPRSEFEYLVSEYEIHEWYDKQYTVETAAREIADNFLMED